MPPLTELMRQRAVRIIGLACAIGTSCLSARALTPISVTSQTPGPTPFIANITTNTGGGAPLAYVGYWIAPKPGSYTRPIAAAYTASYLAAKGDLTSTSVTVPVFGLYAGTTNTVTLFYFFGSAPPYSAASITTTVTTAPYTDPCNRLNTPAVQQNRTSTSGIGFDLFMLKNSCSPDFPALVDTDGNVRWVGDAHVGTQSAILYKGAVYASNGRSGVNKITLDGVVSKFGDYAAGYNVTFTGHHNFDPGRNGIIIDVNTSTQTESTELEIDAKTGKVLQVWDMSQIISAAMVAGGDGALVNKFVYPAGTDWFHNNASTYNPADNTLIISSREYFVS